jgi:predicted DNA-binding protein YlxM (UPF0122 family)
LCKIFFVIFDVFRTNSAFLKIIWKISKKCLQSFSVLVWYMLVGYLTYIAIGCVGFVGMALKRIHINFEKTQALSSVLRESRDYFAHFTAVLKLHSRMLGGKDYVLMQMYLEKGYTYGQMARLLGVDETTIARRIHRLARRLVHGEYIRRLRSGRKLNRLQSAVASDYFLEGLSQKAIAQKREITVYQVRQALERLRSLVDSEATREGKDADL